MDPPNPGRVLVIHSALRMGQLILETLVIHRNDDVKITHKAAASRCIIRHWFPDLVICETDNLENYLQLCCYYLGGQPDPKQPGMEPLCG